MLPAISLFVVFSLFVFDIVKSTSLLHSIKEGETSTTIKGQTITDRNINVISTKSHRIVDFSIALKSNVVIWDHLEQEDHSIILCTQIPDAKTASIEIGGEQLNQSNFQPGVTFVIASEDWENHCGEMKAVQGLDKSDASLFFRIRKSISLSNRNIILFTESVPGSDIVPVVDITVHSDFVHASHLPQKIMFLDTEQTDSRHVYSKLKIAEKDLFLHQTGRTTFFGQHFDLSSEHIIDFSGSATTNVQKFRLERLDRIKFSSESKFEFDANVKFHGGHSENEMRKDQPTEKKISLMDFSAKIPGVGRIQVGTAMKVNWVVDVKVGDNLKSRSNKEDNPLESNAIRMRNPWPARIVTPSIPPTLSTIIAQANLCEACSTDSDCSGTNVCDFGKCKSLALEGGSCYVLGRCMDCQPSLFCYIDPRYPGVSWGKCRRYGYVPSPGVRFDPFVSDESL